MRRLLGATRTQATLVNAAGGTGAIRGGRKWERPWIAHQGLVGRSSVKR